MAPKPYIWFSHSESLILIDRVQPVTITQKISAAAESIIKRQGEIQTSAEEADKAIEGIGGDTSGIDGATKALGYLKDAESGVIVVQDEFTKTRITNIVNQLRDTVPELADAWNENTGELSLTNEQLVEYIKNAENAAKTKAYAEALQTLYDRASNNVYDHASESDNNTIYEAISK